MDIFQQNFVLPLVGLGGTIVMIRRRLHKYLSKSFEVFLERAGGVEPGDREVPVNPFFREEKQVYGTPPARS